MSDPTLVWTAVGIVSTVVLGLFGLMLTLQGRRETRYNQQNTEIKTEIKDAVEHLGEVLTARMETKETVNGISVRLARVEGAMGIRNDAGNPGSS